jgi:hypothetical protein
MPDPDELKERSKALRKECIMVVAQTQGIKKAIRTVKARHPGEPWAAEFVQKWQTFLDQHGAQYF